MADATQIAFAFFSYVCEHNDGGRDRNLGMDDGLSKSKHADDAGGIVAGPGSGKVIGAIVATQGGIERRGGGKNCIEMRGEHDYRTSAVGGKMCRRDESVHVADNVGVDIDEANFSEACGDPFR